MRRTLTIQIEKCLEGRIRRREFRRRQTRGPHNIRLYACAHYACTMDVETPHYIRSPFFLFFFFFFGIVAWRGGLRKYVFCPIKSCPQKCESCGVVYYGADPHDTDERTLEHSKNGFRQNRNRFICRQFITDILLLLYHITQEIVNRRILGPSV